ncbi:MAG TPA: hypothetical protein VIW24_06455 [Aldersonia sp.]
MATVTSSTDRDQVFVAAALMCLFAAVASWFAGGCYAPREHNGVKRTPEERVAVQ